MRADVSRCFVLPPPSGVRILANNYPQAVLEWGAGGEQNACSWDLEVQQDHCGRLQLSKVPEAPAGKEL